MKKLEFLIIDPQVDFCDPNGALFVSGADQDAVRLTTCIERLIPRINDIHITLDQHHTLDVAHPLFWKDSKGNHPSPFTIITKSDVENGVWTPFNPAFINKMVSYTSQLEIGGRYALCVWPPHCLIGSVGASIYKPIQDAVNKWIEKRIGMVDFVTKGSNIWTEHYSGVQADVPDASDPTTQLNTRLIDTLQRADIIALSGQALSHCVRHTVTDIANNFGDDNIQKLHLLIDTSSSVPGFEREGQDFVDEMSARGMKVVKSDEFLI